MEMNISNTHPYHEAGSSYTDMPMDHRASSPSTLSELPLRAATTSAQKHHESSHLSEIHIHKKGSISKEWIPLMLKRPALVAVAVVCCGAIAALEALRYVTSSRAVSPENRTILNLAKYMPTLGVIAIAFAFRAVATDVKKLTPWSNMSGRWATGEQSILLDYHNKIEALSVFQSIGKKDWAITAILTATFFCGALVPFSNSLIYVDLAASQTIATTLTKTSVFDFEEFPLVLPDGNLTIPKNYTGEKPYAHVFSERESGGNPAPWTTDKYAFDRFSMPDTTSKQNGTMTADVNAVSVGLKCEQAQYSMGDGYTAHVASCPLAIEQEHTPGGSWLNITQCSNDPVDLRITVTINTGGSIGGVICSPTFTQQTATASVNITSNELVDFTLIDEPQNLDVSTSVEALWLYLMNPLDTQTLKSYGRAGQGGPYDADQIPVANTSKIISLVNDLAIYKYSTDTFTSLLPADATGSATKLDDLQKEVEILATEIWAQVINLLSRKPVERSLPGKITLSQKKILVWRPALRAMQALLALLAVVCITFCTGLRPSTALSDDPSSLAATSLVMADSGNGIEKLLAPHATSSQDQMQSKLQDIRFRFGGRAAQGQQLCVNDECLGDEQPSSKEQSPFSSPYQQVSSDSDNNHLSKPDPGWRSIPLLMASKIALLTTIILIMVALALMLWSSYRHDGITADTRTSAAAFPLVTSAILVLLGYSCAGVDGAVQILAPFNVMRRRPNQHGIFIDYHSALGRLSELGSRGISAAVIASSAVMLIIMALKIVAAGLFVSTTAQRTMSVNITLDQSLVMNLPDTFGASNSEELIRKACQYAEWQTDPNFELPARSGTIDNLVFSNITDVLDNSSINITSDGSIEARVPAILVDIRCVPISTQNFNLSISYDTSNKEQPWSFAWACSSQFCYDSLNETELSTTGFIPDHAPVVYDGKTGFRKFKFDMGGPPDLMDDDFWLYLTDYSSVSKPFTNKTMVGTEPILANPNTLNVSLPTMQATVCYRNLSSVTVKTTFKRPSKAEIGGQKTLLPWKPVSFDNNSIVYNGSYPNMQPNWFAPPIPEINQYAGDFSPDGELRSDTLWPGRGSSTNFFELLAVYAEYQRQNLSSLVDPVSLAQSTQQMYTLYVTQLLTELRSSVQNSSSLSPTNQQFQASLSYSEPRLMQEPVITYVLEALLALIVVILLWVFRIFPSKAIVPKPPTSIAAQISLLANSKLVHQARDEDAHQIAQLKKWKAVAALGWWPEFSPADNRMSGWRWGIDVGQGAQLQSWNVKPAYLTKQMHSPSQSTSSDLELTPLGAAEQDERGQSMELLSRIALHQDGYLGGSPSFGSFWNQVRSDWE
ncbi:unnamed protein product [Penicillium pancosmium]